MNLRDYLVNKTEEFEEEVSGIGNQYYKYFNRECNIAIGTWLASGIMYGPTFSYPLAVTVVLATDTTIRAIKGNHGEKAVSGVFGLAREFWDYIKS